MTTNIRRGAHTPWGVADSVTCYEDGIFSVGTPSHGGFMIRHDVAQAKLSPAAIACGEPYGTPDYLGSLKWAPNPWLCYEEDSGWTVLMWEMPDLWPQAFRYVSGLARFGADVCVECANLGSVYETYGRVKAKLPPAVGEVGGWGFCRKDEHNVRTNHRMATDTRGYLLYVLSAWNHDYLNAIGQEPDPVGHALWESESRTWRRDGNSVAV